MAESAIKRRLTPSVPLSLDVENGDGSTFRVDVRLAFNMNVLAAVRERSKVNLLADVFGWIDDPLAVKAVLWAACIPFQPEFDSDEGFEAIGEYMTLENRNDTIEALLKAYTYFVRKDKRDKFVESAKQLVDLLRTGKVPDARPSPESETTNPAIPSTSTTLQTSPNTTSDSLSNNSENSQPIVSIGS